MRMYLHWCQTMMHAFIVCRSATIHHTATTYEHVEFQDRTEIMNTPFSLQVLRPGLHAQQAWFPWTPCLQGSEVVRKWSRLLQCLQKEAPAAEHTWEASTNKNSVTASPTITASSKHKSHMLPNNILTTTIADKAHGKAIRRCC